MARKEDYKLAMREFETGTMDEGLWAQAFAESEGNMQKAISLYLQRRAAEIEREALGGPWTQGKTVVTELAKKAHEETGRFMGFLGYLWVWFCGLCAIFSVAVVLLGYDKAILAWLENL